MERQGGAQRRVPRREVAQKAQRLLDDLKIRQAVPTKPFRHWSKRAKCRDLCMDGMTIGAWRQKVIAANLGPNGYGLLRTAIKEGDIAIEGL